jgi:hypothetical protein
LWKWNFESGASTNFTTPANSAFYNRFLRLCQESLGYLLMTATNKKGFACRQRNRLYVGDESGRRTSKRKGTVTNAKA